MAPDGAEESCCSQKKPHLPRAEVKVEGENRRLALTQGLTTEPFSTLPSTSSPASLFLRRVRGHVSNNRLIRRSYIRKVTHKCRKTGASAAELCKTNVSLQPPQFAECVSCCIKQHILRFGDVVHVHRPVNSRCRGIKDEERTEGI